MILVLDNRDSFTFNLVQALQALGEVVEIHRARNDDRAEVDAILARHPERILIGPGPGHPRDARVSIELVRREHDVPILGVCLGHQAIGLAFGGAIVRAPELVHGRAVAVEHDGKGVFRGVRSPAAFTRYNSLSLEHAALPSVLEVTARTADGDVMGVRHRTRPIEGVQFHPESILSEAGAALALNFVRGPEAPRPC